MATTTDNLDRHALRGRRIKEASHAAGITLRDLASLIGVSRPTIYAYVAGTLRVPARRLQQIADFTGRPLAFFDQSSDHPGRWDGEMAVLHTDALMSAASYAKAADFALKSLDLVPPIERFARGRLLQRVGTCHLYLGDYIESMGHLEDAIREFGAAQRPDCQGDCSQSLGYCYLNLGKIELALDAFADAEAKCDPQDRWRPRAAFATAEERAGEFLRAEERLARIAEEENLSSIARVYIDANLATLASNRGYWNLAVERSLPVLDAATELGLHDQAIERMMQIGHAHVHQGRHEEASLWLIRAADAANFVGDHARGVLVRLITASLAAEVGEGARARKEAVEALADATRHHYRRSEAFAHVLLARLALQRRDPDGALDLATQAQTFCETYGYYVHGVQAAVCKARSVLALGDAKMAMHLLDTLLTDPRVQALGEPRADILAARAEAAGALEDSENKDKFLKEADTLRLESLARPGTGEPGIPGPVRAYFLVGTSIRSTVSGPNIAMEATL